jgi:hypothetical protein
MEEEEEMVKVMTVRGRGGSIPLCAVLTGTLQTYASALVSYASALTACANALSPYVYALVADFCPRMLMCLPCWLIQTDQ